MGSAAVTSAIEDLSARGGVGPRSARGQSL